LKYVDYVQCHQATLHLVCLWLKVLAYQIESMIQFRTQKCERTQDKKSFNKSKHPKGEDGRFVYTTGTVGDGKGAVEVNLGFGSEKPEFVAEMTHKRRDKNHKKHATDMGLNFRQWKQEAAILLNDEHREYYKDWEIPDDDTFNRFNTKTGRLAVGDKNGTINTYFKPEKSKLKYYLPKEYLEETEKKK